MSAKKFMSYGDAETVLTGFANAIKDNKDAVSSIKDGTNLDSFGDVEVALLDKADTSDLGTAAAKDSTNAVTAGSTDLVESGAVKEAIDVAVAAAYHHAGTKTVAQLTHDLLITANEGNVYNITDSGTTTSDFIEGIGKQIDSGDNVGICKVGNVYMFDLLSGLEDTSIFIQKSQTTGLLKNDGTVNTTIEDTVASHTTAINGKQDTLTFDDTPTDGSNNPVKSNGIYDALANSANYIANTGVKNLIPIPFLYEDVSGDGLTYTINSDGTVEIDGTASATKRFYLIAISSNFIFEKGQTYTLTDGTSDSANDKYVLEMALFNGNTYVNRAFRTANGSVTFTLPTNIEYDRVTLYFVVYNGVQLSHKLFKPMVRYSAVKNADYVYAKTNKQLTDDVALLDSRKTDTDMVAADFNAGTSYTAGNYCVQDGKLYKFKNNHSGAWSSADVDEVKITGELSALKSGLNDLGSVITPTVGTNITLLNGGYTVIGNMVCVNLSISTAEIIPFNTLIATIVPPAISDTPISIYNIDTFDIVSKGRVYVNGNIVASESLDANAVYSIVGCYIKAS